MFEHLSNQNLVKLCISFVILFLLSGCGCIKPEDSSGLREKLDIVSTEQKWVDSGVYISDKIKVTEINIVPNKVNFCSQYKDFAIEPGVRNVTLPFALKAGDAISFSVVGSKMCKNDHGTVTYKKIDESCGEGEKEYFSHVLNQEKCQGEICPNKYEIGNAQWLNGKEYWSSELDQSEREEIRNVIDSIKQQGENVDCSKLSESSASKIDTRILNLLCGRICKFSFGSGEKGCVYIEYNSIEGEIFNTLSSRGESVIAEIIDNVLKEKWVKTDITLLRVRMDNEEFEHIPGGGICINCDHKIDRNHPKPELTFSLGDGKGKGGFNIRVTRIPNLEKSLYISVSDKFPEREPDETQGDIPVDISKVYNTQYMEGLKEKLKDKSGTIYYGIRDHGCDYKKNEGQFSINLTTKEPPVRTFSAIYNFFDEKVKTAFFGSSYKDTNVIHSDTSPVKSLYQSFVASNRTNTIRSTIVSLLVLYIVLYTLYYFFGLSHASIYEFLIICVKIGVITQLLNDNSWSFFYNNAFSIFVNAPKQLIEIANFRGTTSNVFEFLDLPLNRFLSAHSVLLIVSLIFSGPLGIVSFCLVIWGLITVSLSMFNALFSFITSIAIVALLLSLAPLFIICLLFGYTRQMFHNWVKNLARFAIHPVVLLIFISLISQVMDYIVYSVFNFEVCPTCILNLNLKIFNPCILYGYASKHAPNITAMIAFVILGHAMKALVEASSTISDSLFGVYVASEPGRQYQQSLMGTVGLDEQSIQRRAGQQSGTPSRRPQIPQSAQRSAPKIPTNTGNQ
ncbi:type IV secretion system protein [Wolbachia endosymbiont of Diaphorina citri]|jgi:Type IV secretory pathway, VirB6 components|uniref:type IV secretion system protein n=1 Tax=Wolbachia endosymbiont of Diaphorina citri TaxID=116598 RepID=UPI0002D97EC8|nr:type IV secretion system protein [Wolbachia endosymbiont of Diaphorina citri]QJT94630.1 type IV secretion system protein [Wolbachia endosymbiont of Diaphorina citri]QJT95869.1 type IV secretion system protein [Wolbachia endosymbiont of Diaphorina citri]QJT97231.1 type IV secretion system protein [Wolbachia endosymbiont of Diaphorina citri]QLK11527.1 type IV secretion system protein [Wolbachia endosymbiont of Diaphorina citri]QXY86940.1 type IV secretion system protein [Wolbachia endosymbion